LKNYKIPLNKPFLPSKIEFEKYVAGIWKRNWLTNHGPLVEKFEFEIANFLDVERMLFVTNGTIALQIAIRALDLQGEIITTPYSYVATTSSIVWQNCKPIFVDIDKESLNIDSSKIEDAVTDKTTAILATHVYGNPCDVESIKEIAEKHNLKLIYDAAHCFGVKYKGESIFKWGDISATSFHATKVFHTVEGGGLFTSNDELYERMKYMMNFGHDGPYLFKDVGINGKNTEFHAAMGLSNLTHANECLERRKDLTKYYNEQIRNLPLKRPKIKSNTSINYAYYPVLFETAKIRSQVVEKLKKHQIETRSYFRPCLSELSYVDDADVPISKSVSERVVCLPFFFDLQKRDIDKITGIIKKYYDKKASAI
jgi:dTDP-4-amino-4,6-dideoxygalactose transaminase